MPLEDGVLLRPVARSFTNVVTPRSHVPRRHAFARTLVRQGATLGANSTLLCGIEVGRYAFVGAGAVVTRDVPPYAWWCGNPARHVGWACACGEEAAAALEGWVTGWRAEGRVASHADRAAIARYERRRLTAEFAAVLDRTVADTRADAAS